MRRAVVADGVVWQLRTAVTAAQPFKQTHEVGPVGPVEGVRGEQARDRKAGVDTHHMRYCGRFKVE